MLSESGEFLLMSQTLKISLPGAANKCALIYTNHDFRLAKWSDLCALFNNRNTEDSEKLPREFTTIKLFPGQIRTVMQFPYRA